ncbi:putative heme degradation protein [Aminobacter aminovorans]|uniref:Haemin-degrading HenS.ChuX domain n=1 Tax=Aminobacter aminovorans TaxID=83263 RepID=A0A380WDA8_AMIAI|nr:ChuX/HutX family heme-like substrate-binding protein [Aminobacter aminovorans]TCS25343.1 putative heme degradation protein [Aminobacter aminovorans]SUU86993.1 Haemin-degrading HenS.ChuX domain [Aminobacter aminovorans]
MTARTPHKRERLDVTPAALLARLPAIGRVMINSERRGATHERIGSVEKVRIEDGWLVCEGAEHDSRIELAAIATVIVDRTSVMREKSYPRIELRGADGESIANVTGFEGLDPFDAVLAAFPQGTDLPVEERKGNGLDERKELDADDAGLAPFAAAERSGGRVRIEFSRTSFWQAWEGDMPAVKPVMGYVNVMRPDFHLHLKGGSVGGWRREDGTDQLRFVALAADGAETGLTVSGAPASFG